MESDWYKFKRWFILLNYKTARKLVIPRLLMWLNIGVGSSPSRWGVSAFLVTAFVFFVSLFFTLLFVPYTLGGTIMMWIFFVFAIISGLLLMCMTVYFLCCPSKDATMEHLTKIEKKTDSITNKLDNISKNMLDKTAANELTTAIQELTKTIKNWKQ